MSRKVGLHKQLLTEELSDGIPPRPLPSRGEQGGALQSVPLRRPLLRLPPETSLVPAMPQEARLALLPCHSTQLKQQMLHQVRLLPPHLRGRMV